MYPLYLLQMKVKLLNNVSRTQIGYYQNGDWQPKIMFNFKLLTYVSDPIKDVKGWIGHVRVHEDPDRVCELFFSTLRFGIIQQDARAYPVKLSGHAGCRSRRPR